MNKKKKQKIKLRTQGQKALKQCKTCKTLLNPFSNSNYCSDECKKHDMSTKEVIMSSKVIS